MKRVMRAAGLLAAAVLAVSAAFGTGVQAETRYPDEFDFQTLYPKLAPGEEMPFHIYSTHGIHIFVVGNTDKMTRVAYKGGDERYPVDETATIICGANEKADEVKIYIYNGPANNGHYDTVLLKVVKDGSKTDGTASKWAGTKEDTAAPAGTAADAGETTVKAEDVALSTAGVAFADGTKGSVATAYNAYLASVKDAEGNAVATFALAAPSGLVPFTVADSADGKIVITAPTTTAKSADDFILNISASDKAALAAKGITAAVVNGAEVDF